MAYQDDFRNKVIKALKAKNLAVDISEEANQKAIVQEVQNVAKLESRPMSSDEMKLVLKDVATQINNEKQQAFSAQSADFTAFGTPQGGGGSFSGGGIAVSVMNKDIVIIPTAGTATSINTLSQIDFKIISNPNAYGVIDPNEVKSSLYNWGERISGNTFDTPVLGLGGAWGGVSYTPTAQYGTGGSQGSGVGGSINSDKGFGQIIFFKPATSTIYSSLINDIGLDTSFASRNITLTGYQQAVPGSFPTAGFAVTFGGIGNSGDIIFHGAISEAQTNTIKFLSPLTISNSTVTDLITLGLSSASSTVQNFVGGGTAQFILSTTTSSFARGDIFYASGTGHVNLTKLAIGTNNQFLTTDGSTPSWTSSISANTVSISAAIGSTILFPIMNNSTNSGVALSYDVDFNVDPSANILRYATGSFYVGTAVSSPIFTGAGSLVTYTSTASVVIKPGVNTTTAIALQKVDGTNIFVVDTSNNRIGINMTPGSFALDVAGSANLSSTNAYNINGTSVLNATTLGSAVVSSSLTSVGIINSGTWSATAITVFYGGTGFQTYAVGDILFADTVTTLAKRAAVATGSVLASLGTNTAPNYVATSTLSVGTAVTANNLNLANGLTNAQHTLLFSQTATGTGIAISTNTTISFNPSNFILSTSGLAVTNTTATTTTTSGALIVSGGLGLAGNAFIGGTVFVSSATPSNFSNLLVSNTTATTSNTSGALVVSGGLGLAGNAFIGGTINVPSTSTSNISNVTFANGIVTAGTWQGSAIATTYGGTGSNLGSASANANKIVVLGTAASGYAATLIDGVNTGRLLAAQGNGSAPTFVNTTDSAFTFNSGTLTINNATISTGTITGTPTNANDLVNKTYADSISGGLDPHASVRLTTISAIGGSYRQLSGLAGTTWGQGDYIIATSPAELIGVAVGFDTVTVGIALTNGQRVLVKDGVLGGYASGAGAYGAYPTTYGGFASSWVANGIYTVTSYGGAATSGWLLIRATDTDNQSGVQELTGGAFTFVEEGTNFGDNAFVCINDTTSLGPIGFGSTQIAWSPFSGGSSLTMGQGLSKSGNTIAANFNFTGLDLVSGITFKGFTIGGARSNGVGSSSHSTFIVTSASAPSTNTLTANATGFSLAGGQLLTTLKVAGVTADNTITGAADGFTLAGGTTARTLTVIGGNISLNGSGFGLTLSSQSILNLNSFSLGIAIGSSNITFQSGSASGNTSATIQVLVQNGQSQFQLSTATSTMTRGDLYFGGQSGVGWTSMDRLVLASGAGSSVLIRSDTVPVWGTIQLGSANFVSGTLTTTNGGTSNGSITVTNGQVVFTDGNKLNTTAAGTAGSVLISTGAGAPLWNPITLSNTSSVSGTLAIANGGTNAAAANFTSNGVVIFDSGSTRLASATGLTMTGGTGLSVTGTVAASGGFFVGANSVVTNVAGINGSVGFTSQASNGGTSFIQVSGQSLILNFPGTGITGNGAVTQVPYYNAARELTGDVGLVYSRTAASGVGLSLNVNATTGTILRINSAQTFTSGLLLDIDNSGVQALSVDFKGMTSIAAASGNTVLVVSSGRTILSAPNTNYASLNFGNTVANPGSGNTAIGDLWFNGTNLYFRKDATTSQDLLIGSVSGSGTANKVVKWNTSTSLTDSNILDAGFGMTITSGGSIATAGSGATALLTLQSLAADDNKTDRYFIRGMSTGGGTATTRYFSIDTAGNLRANTKSFDIPHPTKDGMRLVYGVLEGPEHGAYHRGTVEGNGVIQVNLPDYWHKLVGDQYTIQLTPCGNYNVCIDSKTENYFTIKLVGDFISRKYKNIKVDYIVHGSRLDAPLETEQ